MEITVDVGEVDRVLERAGDPVAYGLVSLKTHVHTKPGQRSRFAFRRAASAGAKSTISNGVWYPL